MDMFLSRGTVKICDTKKCDTCIQLLKKIALYKYTGKIMINLY